MPGKDPIETSLSNVGTKKNFYTFPDDRTVDDEITKAESKFSDLVRSLKASQHGPVSDPRIPYLIAHLEVRGYNLRKQFSSDGEYLVDELLSFLEKPENIDAIILARFQNHPVEMHRKIEAELSKFCLPRTVVKTLVSEAMKNPANYLQGFAREIAPAVSKIKENASSILQKAIKKGHIEVLSESISPKPRVIKYQAFDYHIINIPSDDMIIGDSAVIFAVDSEKKFRVFADKSDNVTAIIFPISRRQVLVGSPKGLPQITDKEIKEAIASCSLEYFVGGAVSKENLELLSIVGSRSHMTTVEERQKIYFDILSEHL